MERGLFELRFMLIVLRVKTVKPPFASPMAAYVCIQLKTEKEKTTKCKKHVSLHCENTGCTIHGKL